MKTAEQPIDVSKLKSEVRLAGLWLKKARRQLKSAKERAGLAKRRRKEAKQAARRARKQAKAAKVELERAERLLAESKANLARENRLRASAKRRKKLAPLAAPKTERGEVETSQPTIAAPRDAEVPALAPAGSESPVPAQAERGAEKGTFGSDSVHGTTM